MSNSHPPKFAGSPSRASSSEQRDRTRGNDLLGKKRSEKDVLHINSLKEIRGTNPLQVEGMGSETCPASLHVKRLPHVSESPHLFQNASNLAPSF